MVKPTDIAASNAVPPEGVSCYAYTFSGHKFLKTTELVGEDPETRLYLGGAEFVDGQPESYYHGEGRVALTGDKPAFQYKLTDHLGNTMVLFEDRDGDGIITTESMSTDPALVEVLQRNFYYAFGLPMQGPWNHAPTDPDMPYLYNGKELEGELGLGWYAYGFRYYDASVGRFVGVDPISDQFPHVSVFNYAENEPVGHIDLWGLQKVSVNDIRNSQGQIVSRDVTVSVNMKVLNLSSKDNFYFNNSLSRAKEKASSIFSTSFLSRVLDSRETGLTTNEIPINVKFILSTQQVSSLDQVSDFDFLLLVVDKVDNENEAGNIAGWGETPGNITMVEAGSMDSNSSETILHELGHNFNLDHTPDGSGLMGATMNGQYGVTKDDLKLMLKGLPVTGESLQLKHSNTHARAKDFLNRYGNEYDTTKARKSGMD